MLHIKKHFYPLLLSLIISIICFQNYRFGTFLTGWDTLHPEFDFLLNLKRLFFGVWRQEQGLGALAAHAHMSDLPRVMFLWFSSLVLPINFLRYFFFFLMLFFGPMGVYFFLKREINLGKRVSFLGGLFYLLNLGTVQHFFVPFEMFASLYGFLPWLLLFTAKYLSEGTRKNLFIFSLLTLLATPMAYASTLWFVYFACFLIYGTSLLLIKLRSRDSLRRLIIITVFTLVINSFWLIPNLYFLSSSGKIVEQAKINQLFSEKAFLYDTKYATIENAAIFKGFLFDWSQYQNGKFTYLLSNWQNHIEKPYIIIIGYGLSLLVLLGLIKTIVKKDKNGLTLLSIFLFSFIFLIHATWPFSLAFDFLREKSPLFKEALRFPWTKFSIIAIFAYSIYFALFTQVLIDWFKNNKWFKNIFIVFVFLLLIIWTWPIFTGNLINQNKKLNIPNEYFETFKWFKNQPDNQRIAVFPMPTFWGWEFYDWGFEGAGFIWFGLKQPVLVRDFDRWNHSNENYYWEASYALYSKNLDLLEKVLEKYQVYWIILDENVINPAFPKAVNIDEFKEMIKGSSKISEKQNFGGIHIYQTNLSFPQQNFVTLGQNMPFIGPAYEWNNLDQAYVENGPYLNDSPKMVSNMKTYYPFRSLFAGKNQENMEFQIEDQGYYYLLKKEIPKEYRDFVLPKMEDLKELVYVDPENLGKETIFQPQIVIANNYLEVTFSKIKGYYSAGINPLEALKNSSQKNCNQFTKGKIKTEIIKEGNFEYLRLQSQDAINCDAFFELPALTHQLSYLINIRNRNEKGETPVFWVENQNLRKADLESSLLSTQDTKTKKSEWQNAFYVQPPMESDGIGYILHFDNRSIGKTESINDLSQISVNPFPFQYLSSLKLISPNLREIKPFYISTDSIEHQNPSLYKIQIPSTINHQPLTIILSQSYNEGWQAYRNVECRMMNDELCGLLAPVLGEKIKDHVLVNNWENGWQIELGTKNLKQKTIYIVYLPQYLEYFGFGLFFLLFPSFFIMKKLLD